MRLAFFRYLRPEAASTSSSGGAAASRSGWPTCAPRWTTRERMDAYTIELMDHGLDEREREIAWLDRPDRRRSTESAVEQDPRASGSASPIPARPPPARTDRVGRAV